MLVAHPVEGDTSPPLAATPEQVRKLAMALCELLRTQAGPETHLLTQLSLAAVRNLIYLVRHSVKVPLARQTLKIGNFTEEEQKEQDGEAGGKNLGSMEEKGQYSNSKKNRMKSVKKSKGFVQTTNKRRRTSSEGSEEQNEEESRNRTSGDTDSQIRQKSVTESDHTGTQEEKSTGKDNEAGGNTRALVTGAMWVLHRVGNMAYEELQTAASGRTVTREALLNLMAGLLVVAGPDAKAPRLFTYIIKHLARELTDEHLPEELKARTQEVANLVKETVGVETYTRHLAAAQTALARKRLDRRAQELQQKVVDPQLAQRRKRKKQEALKESRKRRIAVRKGKNVKGGKWTKGGKSAKASKGNTKKKKAKMMDEVVIRE